MSGAASRVQEEYPMHSVTSRVPGVTRTVKSHRAINLVLIVNDTVSVHRTLIGFLWRLLMRPGHV